MELEVPAATANIDFLTNKQLNTLFVNLIIVVDLLVNLCKYKLLLHAICSCVAL